MSTLENQIREDLKQAMRDKNELTLSVLRMLSSVIKNKIIAMRGGEEVVLSDEQVREAVSGEMKKRLDAIEAYRSGGREELAAKEEAEMEILQKYLPAQLSDEEIEAEVTAAVGTETDFGKAMGKAMGRLKGKADGKRVGEAVRKLLNK